MKPKEPSLYDKVKARKFFRPIRPELPTQCASCPFKTGNDKEFGEVCSALFESATGTYTKMDKRAIEHARKQVKKDLKYSGDFACHKTVYNADMSKRSADEHMQCPGATAYFKAGSP